jgi:hypothetical protein
LEIYDRKGGSMEAMGYPESRGFEARDYNAKFIEIDISCDRNIEGPFQSVKGFNDSLSPLGL